MNPERLEVPTDIIHQELKAISRGVSRGKALTQLVAWGALGVLWLAFAGVGDLLLKLPAFGRWGVFACLVILLGVGLIQVCRQLWKRRSAEAWAALLEEAFPELDNHLINYIQFSQLGSTEPLALECVRREVPGWRQLDLSRLKDRPERRRAWVLFGGGLALLLLPFCWNRAAFENALCRVLQPWSERPPSTLAQIVAVTPGNADVVPGAQLTLCCEARGKAGQEVALSLWPADDRKRSMILGQLSGQGIERFTYRQEDVVVGFEYKFRVGDATADRFAVTLRDPVAVSALTVTVQPPAYTALPTSTHDALQDRIAVPDGSTLTIQANYSAPVDALSLWIRSQPLIAKCSQDKTGRAWVATLGTIGRADDVLVEATARDSSMVSTKIALERVADSPPVITIDAPDGQASLGPGARPAIAFSVDDDYGLSRAWVELVAPQDPSTGQATLCQDWQPNGERKYGTVWRGKRPHTKEPKQPRELVFRVWAQDCAVPPNRATSRNISFLLASAENTLEALKRRREETEQSDATLATVVELQTRNVEATRPLLEEWIRGASEERWKEVKAAQVNVRETTGKLLESARRKPFAALTQTLKSLYQGPMREVLEAMDSVEKAPPDVRSRRLDRCLKLEERILEDLMRVQKNADKARQHSEATNILAMLDAVARDQESVLEATRKTVQNDGSAADEPGQLMLTQDRVAGDMSLFVEYCREQEQTIRWVDGEFAACLKDVIRQARDRDIAPNMFRAAEQLELGQPKAAVPHQERALEDLKHLRQILHAWRTKKAKENRVLCQEALEKAKETLVEARKAQRKAAEALREVVPIKGELSEEELAAAVEEQQRLREEVDEGLLAAAKDLHVFPELAVGTEMAEEVRDIYEKTKQVAGSKKNPISEAAIQKDDNILEEMDNLIKRLKDSPYWLPDVPDAVKRDYEAYDQEELPEIPAVPMDEKVDDLIGELMEQEEDLAKESEDSASNRGGSMDSTGNASVKDLNFVNYSAKGKTGNRRPEHSERGGRSIVGRQGMSEGETVPKEGTLREGDPNMEARRTRDDQQDGEVDAKGEQAAKATGGGKGSGYGDEAGMPGSGARRESSPNAPVMSRQAQLRRNVETLYASLGFAYYRTGSLDEALRNMRAAERAAGQGQAIGQIAEYQHRALAALRRTRAELMGGILDDVAQTDRLEQDQEERFSGMAEQAPERYRTLVSEYFKALGQD